MWNKILVILYNRCEDDNNSSHGLECKEVENYDEVIGTNYLTIFYSLALGYKQRLKKIYLTKIKRHS
jgi:hypothetical protein